MIDYFFILKWYLFGRLKIGRRKRKKAAFEKFNKLLSSLGKGSRVIDAGANVGEFTKIFLDKGCTVHAFEPDPIAIIELKRRCQSADNLILLQSAVGLKNEAKKLYRYRKFDEENPYSTQGSSLLEYRSGKNKPFVEIKVINLIEYIKKLPKDLSLLKMDIEGSEVEILNEIINEGMHRNIDNIFVETHERFSHSLGIETAKLKLKIKKLNIRKGFNSFC